MSDFFINLMTAVVIPPLSSGATRWALGSSRDAFYCGWLVSALFGCGWMMFHQQWGWMGAAAGNALLAGFLWWRKRRRRKRAPRAYGAKSRALIQNLVRRAREQARPRPVLRPLPNPG